MSSFFDEVKQAQEESHQTWFDRWVENNDIKKQILISAKKGYNGYNINATERKHETLPERAVKKRIRSQKTVELMKEYLGDGFTVKVKVDNYRKILDIERQEYHLNIRWEGEK